MFGQRCGRTRVTELGSLWGLMQGFLLGSAAGVCMLQRWLRGKLLPRIACTFIAARRRMPPLILPSQMLSLTCLSAARPWPLALALGRRRR